MLKEIAFFKSRDLKGPVLHEILMIMDLEHFDQGDTVMKVGEEGDKFYFVVDGVAEIQIPDPALKDEYHQTT